MRGLLRRKRFEQETNYPNFNNGCDSFSRRAI
jgi:hypothetical protein